jgi:hypothetical protein
MTVALAAAVPPLMVAVTENVPAVAPAVYCPPAVIVPPVAVHTTAVLVVPVTDALNCVAVPGTALVVAGDTVTDRLGDGAAAPTYILTNVAALCALALPGASASTNSATIRAVAVSDARKRISMAPPITAP